MMSTTITIITIIPKVVLNSNCFFIICLSALIFMILNQKIMNHLRPQLIEENEYIFWKWRNIMTSLIHSFIVGFGVLNVVLFEKSLVMDMMRAETSVGNALICISTGYFVYDLILSATNLLYPGRIEIIIHHSISLCCLTVSLSQQRFLAYCVVGLTVEISSFFIHVRELLTLSGVSKLSKIYLFNSVITVFTLITFRFLPLSWISMAIYRDRQYIESALLLMGVVFLAIIYSVSSVLLYRVITTDFNCNLCHDLMQFIGIHSTKLQFKCSSKMRKFF